MTVKFVICGISSETINQLYQLKDSSRFCLKWYYDENRIITMNTNVQYEHKRTIWTQTYNMNTNVQYEHSLTSIRFIDTLHSFIRVRATGKCKAMTILIMLNSEMQVKTVWAFKISPVNTYVIKVAKLISAEELKKNDMKVPWMKFSFRNHLSSSLLIKKEKQLSILQCTWLCTVGDIMITSCHSQYSPILLFEVNCNNITNTDSLNHLLLLFFLYENSPQNFYYCWWQLLNGCPIHTSGWVIQVINTKPQFVWLV